MKIWIGNIAPGTTDDDLRALLQKYGLQSPGAIERVEGDGSRPAATVEAPDTPEILYKVTTRLNGMHWRGRTLVCQTLTR